MADKVLVGNMRRLKVSFYNGNTPPELTDPTDVVLIVKKPSGAVTVYEDASKDATGKYYRDIELDESGVWYYRYEGTGGIVSKEEDEIVVTHSRVI